MNLTRRTFMAAIGAAAGGVMLGAAPGLAQEAYPSKPIRLLVPFGAGGGQDEFGRRYIRTLGEIGNRIFVENKPGGNSILATQLAANSPPDGYTLLQQTNSFTANPILSKDLGYDGLVDFAPISLVARTPHVLLVNSKAPMKTVTEFIAAAKASKQGFNYGSAGIGSTNHLAALMLSQAAGAEMVHVAYRGAAEFNTDLLGGRLDFVMGGSAQSAVMHNGGQARALAVTAAARTASLPGVPTFKELGLDVEIYSWTGYLVPVKTPAAIVARLLAAMQAACRDPEVRKQFPEHELVGSSPAEFGAFLKAEFAKTAELLKDVQI